MTPLRHAHNSPARRWIFFLSILIVLMGCLIQAVRAQEVATTEEAAILPTATLAESLLAPTEIPPATGDPAQLPPTPGLPAPTIEATMLPNLLPATPIPSETAIPPTLLSSATASSEPTQAPTEAQILASITMVSSAVSLPESAVLSLTFAAQSLTGVYSVAIACKSDPAMLFGVHSSPGDLLSVDQVVVMDSGFQAGGYWILVATQASSESQLSGSGVLWSLNYQALAPGLTQIVCEAQLSDRSGKPLPLAAAEMTLTVEAYENVIAASPTIGATDLTSSLPAPTQTETPSVIITVEASPTISPTPEDTPTTESTPNSIAVAPTVEAATMVSPTVGDAPTNEVIAAPAAPETVPALSHLSGKIELSQPLMQAVVTITGAGAQQTVAVQEDGSFAIDIPPGRYEITFSAPHYLSYTLVGRIPAQPVTLATVTLIGADVAENGVVDRADAALVIENFGLAVPPAASAADLNGDHVVNIYDLALASADG